MNTTQEDQQVGKQLSGWDPLATITHIDLSVFESIVLHKVKQVEDTLFSGCDGLEVEVREVLMATLILQYPQILAAQVSTSVGVVARIRRCLVYCSVEEQEFISWHHFLVAGINVQSSTRDKQRSEKVESRTSPDKESESRENPDLKAALAAHQALSRNLIEQNRLLMERVVRIEAILTAMQENQPAQANEEPLDKRNPAPNSTTPTSRTPEKPLRKAGTKRLRDVWIQWRTLQPPLWGPASPLTRQQRHEHKMAVAYLALFLEDGFVLDAASPGFKQEVKRLGILAESKLINFLRVNGMNASALGTVVKAMRELQTHGVLNGLIQAHLTRIDSGQVVDHLPQKLQAPDCLESTQLQNC